MQNFPFPKFEAQTSLFEVLCMMPKKAKIYLKLLKIWFDIAAEGVGLVNSKYLAKT